MARSKEQAAVSQSRIEELMRENEEQKKQNEVLMREVVEVRRGV